MRNWYHDVNISKQAASVKQAANVLSVFVLYRSEKCEQLHRFVNSDSKVYDSFYSSRRANYKRTVHRHGVFRTALQSYEYTFFFIQQKYEQLL